MGAEHDQPLLYWCAFSTKDGNGDLILEKWLSLINHMHNMHKGHGKLYKECEHGRLRKRKCLRYRKFTYLYIASYNTSSCPNLIRIQQILNLVRSSALSSGTRCSVRISKTCQHLIRRHVWRHFTVWLTNLLPRLLLFHTWE